MRALNRRLMLSTTAAGVAFAASPLRAEPVPAPPQINAGDTDWPVYGGNLAYWRYKALDQINAANFNQLQVAWQFKTDNLGFHPEFILQCTPLLIAGRLYATAGSRRDVVCLDAATGEVLWLHKSPEEGARAKNSPRQYSGRGVGYWREYDRGRQHKPMAQDPHGVLPHRRCCKLKRTMDPTVKSGGDDHGVARAFVFTSSSINPQMRSSSAWNRASRFTPIGRGRSMSTAMLSLTLPGRPEKTMTRSAR